jgi:hypothetical protein
MMFQTDLTTGPIPGGGKGPVGTRRVTDEATA